MSLRLTVRAMPTLLKVGFADMMAYRAEMLVWVLATTMPLIMMALWTAVARDAPVGRFGEAEFIAYFLAAFIVRQLTGAWAAWEMNYEIRQGTLSMRLLRPVHPLFWYAATNIAAMPMRMVLALPVAVAMLVSVGAHQLPRDAAMWGLLLLSLLGGWLLNFLVNVVVGCLCFFLESSLKLLEVWFIAFYLFSGYLIPVELFPPWLQVVAAYLPFRYLLGLPVELLTSAHALPEALRLVAIQWAFVAGLWALSAALWRAGLRRFAAYGG